jgi:hypothetical protein
MRFYTSQYSSNTRKLIGTKKGALGYAHAINKGPTLSIHAEHDLINKFMRLSRYKRLLDTYTTYDIMIIRLSKTGIIGYSRPCKNCLLRLIRSKIIINNVYYTDNDKNIMMEKFSQMYTSDKTRISGGDMRHRK